ncbi:MAG: (Fe-S)-binding protein [bacterium]|nr:(Fe-S)-binding protein [bacterium]
MAERMRTVSGPAPPPGAGPTLEALLRRCVQCGLCLPVCATWLASGDETYSPRGRLLLTGQWLAEPEAALGDASWRDALDTCIGCRACSAVCPSGVPHELLEAAAGAARAGRAASGARWLVPLLERPAWLRALGVAAAAGRAAFTVALGRNWRARGERLPALRRLARLVGTVPRAPGSDQRLLRRLDGLAGGAATKPGPLPVVPGPREKLLWFRGCADEGLLPDSARRLRDLLAWAGADLDATAPTACCGALAEHGGCAGRAAGLRARNLAAWGDGSPAAAIVTAAAGCGVAIRDYGPALPAPQIDAIAWLARRARPPFGSVPLRVALHDPCHARHGQGLVAEPRDLLRAIPGLTLLEPDEADVCCGSGGLWSLAHPQLAAEAGRRKAAVLAGTGADLVVTANPGCLGQIADGLALRGGPAVIPLGDLLWYAAMRAPAAAAGRPPGPLAVPPACT